MAYDNRLGTVAAIQDGVFLAVSVEDPAFATYSGVLTVTTASGQDFAALLDYTRDFGEGTVCARIIDEAVRGVADDAVERVVWGPDGSFTAEVYAG